MSTNENSTTPAPEYDNPEYIFSPATWYLFIISGVFIVTAMLHGAEGLSLIHGIWYLLCLPSGYLLLTIYSVANLTDRSWGELNHNFNSQRCYLQTDFFSFFIFFLFQSCNYQGCLSKNCIRLSLKPLDPKGQSTAPIIPYHVISRKMTINFEKEHLIFSLKDEKRYNICWEFFEKKTTSMFTENKKVLVLTFCVLNTI